MKRVSFVSMVIVAVLAFAPAQAQDYELSDDCALIHIYRVGSMKGAAVGYDLHMDDETVIFRVKNKTKTTIKVTAAGLKTLWAKTEKRVDLPVEVQLGHEYYVRCSLKMGAMVGRPFLELVDAKTGKSEYDAIAAAKGSEPAKSAKPKPAPSEADETPVAKTSSPGQLNFGVRGGLNLGSTKYKNEGRSSTGDMTSGVQVGVVMEVELIESLYLQPGFLFSQQEGEGEPLSYIQVPVDALYKLNLNNSNAKLLLHTGPYFGYGLGERMDKHLELGWGLGVGVEFNSCQIGVGYNFGLTKVYGDGDYGAKNRFLCFTFTHFFGK